MADDRSSEQPGVMSAGVVVARREGGAWRLLVLRSYRNWDFPKGQVEPGETPLAAALRETEEETTLTGLDFRWGEAYREVGPYGSRRKLARYYLAETNAARVHLPISPELGRPEHDEWRWADFAEAARLLPERLQPVLAWARATLEG
ncbi:MAG: NUDIX domain-containing protein [Thiobacillaceae bacterium]|nr:NUDIX domain-containing protein [Thiobacillaceae bacterium]